MSILTRNGRCSILPVAVAAALVFAAPTWAAGRSGSSTKEFSGNVCALVKTSLVKAVDVSAGCKPAKTANAPTATIYGAVWSDGRGVTDHRLSIQVWKGKYPGFTAIFKKQAEGTQVKIGSFARVDITYGGENMYILAQGYGILVNLNHSAKTTAENIGQIGAPMTAIGKAIAKQLG
jgi:hypothetical protein